MLSICKALGFIPSTEKEKKKKKVSEAAEIIWVQVQKF
jgi:hypothetical protein